MFFLTLPVTSVAFPASCAQCGGHPETTENLTIVLGPRTVYTLAAPSCRACLSRGRLTRTAWVAIVNVLGAIVAPLLLFHTLFQGGWGSLAMLVVVATIAFNLWWAYYGHAEHELYSRLFRKAWIERYVPSDKTITLAMVRPELARDIASLAGVEVPGGAETSVSYRASSAPPDAWTPPPPRTHPWAKAAMGVGLTIGSVVVMTVYRSLPDLRLLGLALFWLVAGPALVVANVRDRRLRAR